MPTSLGKRIGLDLTEAPLSASPKRVEYAVARIAVAHAPELRVFGRGCIDQLILLVIADQKAHLKGMEANDLGEVILQDSELLVVVPRGDVPDVVRVGPGPKAAPENGVTDLASGSFLRQGEKRFERRGDLISQPRVSPAPRNGDPVGGVGYLEIVHAGAAKQLGQLDGCLIPGLQPVALNGGVAIVAPESQRAGKGLVPVVLRVAAHQAPGLGDLVVRADAFFPPINGGGQRCSPILAVFRIGDVRKRQDIHNQLSHRGNLRDFREYGLGCRILRSGIAEVPVAILIESLIGEITRLLCGCGHGGGAGLAAKLVVPLLAPVEEQLILFDWTADIVSVIVTAQFVSRNRVQVIEEVGCIQ